MNTLTYKGYIGSVSFSEKDNVFKEEGIEPHKSYSGSLNIRLSPETHSRVAILAKQAGMSINAFIKSAVEKQIAMMM